MDEALEAAKESAWREVRQIEAAYARGEIGDAEWHEAMASLVVPAYLAAENPRAGSGHSGTAEDWEWSRGLVAACLPVVARTFLDVGCANDLLMESIHRWTGVEPYGLEISPELAELARQQRTALVLRPARDREVNEEAAGRRIEAEVASWGHVVAGRTERAHRTEPRLVYRAFWINA